MFDAHLYKGGHLLISHKDLHPGSQAEIQLKPILYFGRVSHNMSVGDEFKTPEVAQSLTEFDLSNYPNGIVVTLSQEPGEGQYHFTGTAMQGQNQPSCCHCRLV